MKIFSFIFTLMIVLSCASPAKLFERGVNNIHKAIKMDPSLKLDPDTTVVTNTVTEIDTFDNVIIKTVTNTITNTVKECNYDSLKLLTNKQLRHKRKVDRDFYRHIKKMLRLNNKKLSDSLRYEKKMRKQESKDHKQDVKALKSNNKTIVKLAKQQTQHNNGSWFTRQMGKIWWLLLIIGLVGGFIIARKLYKFKV